MVHSLHHKSKSPPISSRTTQFAYPSRRALFRQLNRIIFAKNDLALQLNFPGHWPRCV
jgi:hypothetical protein